MNSHRKDPHWHFKATNDEALPESYLNVVLHLDQCTFCTAVKTYKKWYLQYWRSVKKRSAYLPPACDTIFIINWGNILGSWFNARPTNTTGVNKCSLQQYMCQYMSTYVPIYSLIYVAVCANICQYMCQYMWIYVQIYAPSPTRHWKMLSWKQYVGRIPNVQWPLAIFATMLTIFVIPSISI